MPCFPMLEQGCPNLSILALEFGTSIVGCEHSSVRLNLGFLNVLQGRLSTLKAFEVYLFKVDAVERGDLVSREIP